MIQDSFSGFYSGKRVLITGHTGFKGSWLSIWLRELGANVIGVGLDPHTEKDNYVLSGIGSRIMADLRVDIRDGLKIKSIFDEYQPEIVFHLAAQSLVRLSYEIPVETYQTNVMGTLNVLDAIRSTESVRVAVMITSDKCYENKEQLKGYEEDAPFGGYDPYSSSKGACEIAIQSWRRSFFNPKQFGKIHHVSLSSARAGNVIGGGDWARDRLIPDCIRAIEAGKPIEIRSPKAIRPWVHVLDPLSGYLLLAKKMWENPKSYCGGWNFGPENDCVSSVWEVASRLIHCFGEGEIIDRSESEEPHEASLLTLNINKAKSHLGWYPHLNMEGAISLTTDWYRRYRNNDVYKVCIEEINQFLELWKK